MKWDGGNRLAARGIFLKRVLIDAMDLLGQYAYGAIVLLPIPVCTAPSQ